MRDALREVRGTVGAMAVALALWGGPVALGQGNAGSAMGLSEALEALDSERFEVREAAFEALVNDPGVSEDEVIELLRGEGLSAEQRWRLRGVLYERFMGSARGAIGISFAPDPQHPTRIGQVHPGFPSGEAGLLRQGDEIIGVEGHPLVVDGTVVGRQALLLETCSRDPGEVLHLRIRRETEDGRTRDLEIEAPLGSEAGFVQAGVRNASDPRVFSEAIRAAAFEVRMERLGGAEMTSDRIRVGVEDEALWEGSTWRPARGAERWSRLLAGPLPGAGEGAGNIRLLTQAQQDARMVRVLNQMAAGQDPEDLRRQLEQRAGGGAIRVQVDGRVEVPVEIQRQIRARQAQLERARAAQKRAVLRAETEREQERLERMREEAVGGDPVAEANRLAKRIGELEGEIAAATRRLGGLGDVDANVRRLGEERIATLRAELAVLRELLRDTIDVALGMEGAEAEASVGEE